MCLPSSEPPQTGLAFSGGKDSGTHPTAGFSFLTGRGRFGNSCLLGPGPIELSASLGAWDLEGTSV